MIVTLDHEDISQKLIEVLNKKNIFPSDTCSRKGICRDCTVDILKGSEYLSKKTTQEFLAFGNLGYSRLSCQAVIESLGIIVCEIKDKKIIRTTSRDAVVDVTAKKEFRLPLSRPKKKIKKQY